MIKVLVHYKQWVDSGNVHFDDTLEDRSKIVEVNDVLELNDMFRHITKIEVINNLTIPVVSVPKGTLIDFYNYIQKNDIDHNIPQRIERMVEAYLKSINAL